MVWVKKSLTYLLEKVQITITPSPDRKLRVFSIRRILPVAVFLLTISTIGVLTGLYKFYQNDAALLTVNLIELKGVAAENQHLKNELFALSQDTEVLKQNLAKLIEHNEEIKNMIELDENTQVKNQQVDLTLQTSFSLNQSILQYGLPIGGGEVRFYYQDINEIIKRTRNNIEVLKQEIPTQQEDLKILETSVKRYKDLIAATPSIWPVADKGEGFISSNFGWRTDPFTGKQAFHEGLDIGVWFNTPAIATADGVVKYAGWINGYGYVVKINHGFGFETRYGHLNKIKVTRGQKVKRGQVLALTGNSGRSNGPHIHYEVRKNNIPQNPLKYIGR